MARSPSEVRSDDRSTDRPSDVRRIALLAGLLAGLCSAPAESSADEADDDERIRRPPVSVTVAGAYRVGQRDGRPIGFVNGAALAGLDDGERVDVMFVIDASRVTAGSSGTDIDGDGRVTGSGGLFGRALGNDSILAAEIAAIESVLEELDDRVTRVGVVAYAGNVAGSADNAWVVAPLTRSYGKVRTRLREMLEFYDPAGSSDLPAGLRLARIALVEAARREGKGAHRRIVLLSEGYPESPRETAIRTEQRTIALARRLRREGIRVHSYAVGPQALERPRAAIEVAEQSRGRYVAVEDPGDLPNVLPTINLGQIEELRVTHVGSGEPALELIRRPDGRYSALVPLVEGQNEVEIYVRASNGAEKRVRTSLTVPRELDPREQLELAALELRLGDDIRRELTVQTADSADESAPQPVSADGPNDPTRKVTIETQPEATSPDEP